MHTVVTCDWCGYKNVVRIDGGLQGHYPQCTCEVCKAEFMLIQPAPGRSKRMNENFWIKRRIRDGTPGPHGVSSSGYLVQGVPASCIQALSQ